MSNIPGAMSESVDQCRKKLRSGDETGTNGGQQEEVENPILLRRSGGVISPDFNCSAVFPEEQSCNTRRFQLSAALRQLHSVILFFVGNDLSVFFPRLTPRGTLIFFELLHLAHRLESFQTLT